METTANPITDTRIAIETPEGADLPLDPAGVGSRMMACMIDWLIKLAINFALSFTLAFTGGFGAGIGMIAFFLLQWFYPVYFEVWQSGATPGKKHMKLLVVNDDGTPVTFAASLLRNLLRVVDFLPFAYLTGIITCISNNRFKRLGDLAAGTLVVYAHQSLPKPAIDITGKQPVPAGFTTDEQRSLLAFAERSRFLSNDRQKELAQILQPVINTNDPVKTIKQIANTMVDGAD